MLNDIATLYSEHVVVFAGSVFVLGLDEGVAYGSGRSIRAFHLLDALESMPDLFTKFGGHRQAAGVTLDAAVVARAGDAEHPGQASLRIRTWKFGQAIFDLTAKPEGVWIASDSMPSPEPAPEKSDRLKSLKPENIAQAWNLFFGDFFKRPGLEATDQPGRTFTVQRREGDTTVVCDIDRATLTPRKYRITDDLGHLLQTLTLARYQLAGEPPVPWPMLIIAQGPDGQVQVRLDEVEVNPDLEDAVLTPPKRAVKQP